jgi:hypothetical protein
MLHSKVPPLRFVGRIYLILTTNGTTSIAAREGSAVVVEVDTTRTECHVRKTLLSEHSEYFKKTLGEPWKKY